MLTRLFVPENIFEMIGGKTRSFDHPSPECEELIINLNIRSFALSTRFGPKWSGGPFFPVLYPEPYKVVILKSWHYWQSSKIGIRIKYLFRQQVSICLIQ